MQRKQKIEATNSEQPKDLDGPSYAEELKRVRTFHDHIIMAGKVNYARNRLSPQFRIPVEIVDEYLCYSEYLSFEVLKMLAEAKMDKNFFYLAQKVKRQLIKIYRHDELSDQKIMLKVSQSMLEMYHEYFEKGKINTSDWQRFLKDENEIENVKKRKKNNYTVRKTKKFKYWAGSPQPSKVRSVNLNDISKKLNDVREGINDINIFDSVKLRMQADKVKKQCLDLAKIHNHMLRQDSKTSRNQQSDPA